MNVRSFAGSCCLWLSASACTTDLPATNTVVAAPRPAPPTQLAPPDTGGPFTVGGVQVQMDQLEAMFRAAIVQARPFPGQKAICFGIDLPDRSLGDPPPALRQKLSLELALPGFPASRCGFDIYPYVTATRDQAMLYTVRVVEMESPDTIRF